MYLMGVNEQFSMIIIQQKKKKNSVRSTAINQNFWWKLAEITSNQTH